MGKVRFELMEFSDGYGCSELDDVSGDYWPDADYRALEAKLAALVEAAEMVCKQSFDVDRLYTDECDALDALKAALDAAGKEIL